MAKNHTFVIPTFTVLASLCRTNDPQEILEDPDLSPYLTQMDIGFLKNTFQFKSRYPHYEAAKKALRQLREVGVPILAGTDAPNPGTTYGASLHQELALLVEAGLTPIEALRSATSVPAIQFGLRERGFIREGKVADLVLVEGDPTQNIRATRKIVGVWKDGRPVDRHRLDMASRSTPDETRGKTQESGSVSQPKMISDFESGKIETYFGTNWVVSTDSYAGGSSSAQIRYSTDGAYSSRGSMEVTGNVATSGPAQWAGAYFSPAKTWTTPVDLSAWNSIVFKAKGDPKEYSVMLFSKSLGMMPAIRNFTITEDWREFEFPFQSFRVDSHEISGFFIGGSTRKGKFKILVDDVMLK